MSFLDCIRTAVGSGKISVAKAKEAEDEFNKQFADAKAAGMGDSAADTHAATVTLKNVSKVAAAKRWQRINEMRTAHALYTRIMEAKTPDRFISVLDDVAQEMEDKPRAIAGQLMAGLGGFIEKYSSKMFGMVHPIENLDTVVDAIYGGSAPQESQIFAAAIKDVNEEIRKMYNLSGASVPENPNFRLHQQWDRNLTRQMPKDVWVQKMLDWADWDLMEYGGKPIPVDERVMRLEASYDTIISDGNNDILPAIMDNQSLANRLSRERFIYLKDAESWKAAQAELGQGTLYSQLMNYIDSAARNLSLMQTLGPNPNVGRKFAERTLRARIGELQVDNAVKAQKLEDLLNKSLARFDNSMDILTRRVDNGAGDPLVQAVNSARSITGTALLGAVVTSQIFTDPAFGMWTRLINRMPVMQVVPSYIHAVVNLKDATQQMINDGLINETAISMMHQQSAYNIGLEGSRLAKMISEVNYRIQGAAAITQVGRFVAGADLSKLFGKAKDMEFDALPFAPMLQNLGITARDWDLVRGTPLHEPEYYSFGKGQFLRPIDMYRAAQNDEARAAANKFLMLQEQFVRTSVPGPVMRARIFQGEHVDGASWPGQLLKSAAQFALFPTSIMFNHWRLAAAAPTATEKLFRFGTLFAFTTVAGAMTAQVKDVLSGKEPAPMDNLEFWTRAIALGGGGAIVGDFIYNNVINSNTRFSSRSPTGQEIAKFAALGDDVKKWYNGEPTKFAKHSIDAAWGLLPKPLPFKLVMERAIGDSLQHWADPVAFARKQQYEREEEIRTGQGHWWGINDFEAS